MNYIFDSLFSFLYKNLFFALFSSFVWGIFSVILSPCHLSSIPLVIGIISNKKINIKKSFLISLFFSLGNLIIIVIIGLITGFLGKILGDTGIIGNLLIAFLLFIMGLYLLDVVKLNFLNNIFNQPKFNKINFLTAFLIGLFFGIGLGPCAFAYLAPILGIVFASATKDLFKSILILSAFGIGHCFIIILLGTFGKIMENIFALNKKANILKIIKKTCGILLILGSIYFIFNIFI